MQDKTLSETSAKQLDRVLSFFPRAEAKASFLFAVNTGLLALIALNVRVNDLSTWYLGVPASLAVLLVGVSLAFVYLSAHPKLEGGSNSLVYFRPIAALREAEYIEKFSAMDEAAFARDVLAQVWRNSEILKAKYDWLERAYVLTATAIIPWFIFLLGASIVHAGTPSIK